MKKSSLLFVALAALGLGSCSNPTLSSSVASSVGSSTASSVTSSTASSVASSAVSSPTSSISTTITIKDLMDREVTIDKSKVDRVVCIGAGALRLYSYVGDMSKLVGAEDIDRGGTDPFSSTIRPYYHANKNILDALPSCGKGGPKNQAPETELIASCRPNIIISEYAKDVSSELQSTLNIPVICLSYGKKQVYDENIIKSITLLGEIFSKENRAKELVDYIGSISTEITNITKDIKEEDKVTTYVGCIGNFGVQDIYSSFCNYPIFEVANVKNVLTTPTFASGYVTVDAEKLQQLNPSKIIIDAAGLPKFKNTYAENKAIFNNLDAFKNGEIYLQVPYNAYYTNLELAYVNTYFAAYINYPSLFGDKFTMANKANEILEKFVGKQIYTDIQNKTYGGYQQITNMETFLQNV